jgi:hypothetical protein
MRIRSEPDHYFSLDRRARLALAKLLGYLLEVSKAMPSPL